MVMEITLLIMENHGIVFLNFCNVCISTDFSENDSLITKWLKYVIEGNWVTTRVNLF